MCKLCDNVAYDFKQYREKRMKGGDFMFKDENNEYGILIDTGDSGCVGVLSNVKYCPICGKTLN